MLYRQYTRGQDPDAYKQNSIENMDIHQAISHLEGIIDQPEQENSLTKNNKYDTQQNYENQFNNSNQKFTSFQKYKNYPPQLSQDRSNLVEFTNNNNKHQYQQVVYPKQEPLAGESIDNSSPSERITKNGSMEFGQDQSQLIDSMRNIALEVSRLAKKNQLDGQEPQQPKPPHHSKISLQKAQPVTHFMTQAQATQQWEQKIIEQQMQYEKQARTNLENLIKSTSNRPKQLILNQLMSGELFPSHNQPPLLNSNNQIYAQTAPSSPRKKVPPPVTPKKFTQTVNRLYGQKQKRNQKVESLKFMQYQEEKQNMRQKPEVLNQSKKLAKKNSLPIYTMQRMKIQVDKKQKKMEMLRKQTDDIKRSKLEEEDFDMQKNKIGANAKKKTENQWIQKADKEAKQYWNNIKKRDMQNENQYNHLQFKPSLNEKSVKISNRLNKQNRGEKVQDRLHKYQKTLKLKKNLIQQRLQPTFKPKLTSSSQRIHHRTTNTNNNSIMTQNYQETQFQVSALQSQKIMSQYDTDEIIQQEEDKEEFEQDTNKQYIQPNTQQHEYTQDQFIGMKYNGNSRENFNVNPSPPSIAPITEQSTYPQLIQNLNSYPQQNNDSDRSLHEVEQLVGYAQNTPPQNQATGFWQESAHRGSGVVLDPALFLGMDSMMPKNFPSSTNSKEIESIQNYGAGDKKEEPMHSQKQSTVSSTTSPIKEKQPISEKRKFKLNSFMTGSSNASSSKRGSNDSSKDFFSFKEKLQNQAQ